MVAQITAHDNPVQVTATVGHLVVGERLVVVSWHGRTTVMWVGQRPPRVTALDRHHRPLGVATAPLA